MAYQGLWNLDFNNRPLGQNTNTPITNPTGVGPNAGGLPNTPGATGTYGGVRYRVDANGIPRIDEGNQSFVPTAGNWGRYGSPQDREFLAETRNGMNYINGVLWDAQGLSSGGPDFDNFVAWAKPIWDAQRAGTWVNRYSGTSDTTDISGTFLAGTPGSNTVNQGLNNEVDSTGRYPDGTLAILNPRPGRDSPNNRNLSYGPGAPTGIRTPPIVSPGSPTGNVNNLLDISNGNLNLGTRPKGGQTIPNTENRPNPNTNTPITNPTPPGTGTEIYPNQPDGQNPQGIAAWNRILNNRDPYGRYGNIFGNFPNWATNQNFNFEGIPDYIRRQFRWNDRAGQDGGTPSWETPEGLLLDRNGQQVIQIGNMSGAVGEGNGSVIDWSRVRYDDDLGLVTSPDNVRDITPDSFRNMRNVILALIAAGAIYGAAAGGGWFTPSGAEIAPNAASAFSGAVQSGSITTQAASTMLSNLPQGVVSGITQAANGAWTAIVDGVRWVWNNARNVWTVLSAANTINNLAGNPLGLGPDRPNGGNRVRNSPTGFGDTITDLGLGANAYSRDRRSIREYQDYVRDLLARGDFNSAYRPEYLERLAQTFRNPEAYINDPTYVAMRDRAGEDLSRKLNARGYNISGNELGELTKLRTEMDYKHLGDVRRQILDSANLGNPTSMYSSALRNADTLLQARRSQNAGLMRNLQNLVPEVSDFVRRLLNQGLDTNEIIRRVGSQFPDIDTDQLYNILEPNYGDIDIWDGEGDFWDWLDNLFGGSG